jgi:hypothetical protein
VSVVVPSHRRASATARAASDELDRQRGRAPIGGSDVAARAAGRSRRCRRTCPHRGAVAVLSDNARQERSTGQPGARPRYVPYPDVRRVRIGVRGRASADAHRRVPDSQAVSENVTPITDWTPPAASSPLGASTRRVPNAATERQQVALASRPERHHLVVAPRSARIGDAVLANEFGVVAKCSSDTPTRTPVRRTCRTERSVGPDRVPYGRCTGSYRRRWVPESRKAPHQFRCHTSLKRGRSSSPMPARLNRSRLLLDANPVYHCHPTASWCPESGQAIVVATHTTPRPVDHTNAFDWRATAATVVPKSPTITATNTAESTRVGTAFGSAGSGAKVVITTSSSGHPAPTANAHDRGSGRGWRRSRGTACGSRLSSLTRRPSMSTSPARKTPPFSRSSKAAVRACRRPAITAAPNLARPAARTRIERHAVAPVREFVAAMASRCDPHRRAQQPAESKMARKAPEPIPMAPEASTSRRRARSDVATVASEPRRVARGSRRKQRRVCAAWRSGPRFRGHRPRTGRAVPRRAPAWPARRSTADGPAVAEPSLVGLRHRPPATEPITLLPSTTRMLEASRTPGETESPAARALQHPEASRTDGTTTTRVSGDLPLAIASGEPCEERHLAAA